jgi:membrane-bound metal-dependent hydrolase YbcI (DUF457 family)
MATPIGHYLLGLAITEACARDAQERRRAPWLATVACMPDLDVLPGLLVGNLSLFHHGASHSLVAAGMAAVASAALLAYGRREVSPRLPILVFGLYASHSVLDSFTLDTTAPIGMPLFWPWSQTFQAPWALLPNVQHTREPLVSAHNALLMVREILILAPLVGAVLAWRSSSRGWRDSVVWVCGASFLVAAGLSIASLA